MADANSSVIAYTDDYSDNKNSTSEAYDYYVDSPYFIGISPKEHIFAGLSIAVFSIPGLLAYLAIVIVILRNPQAFAKKSYYTFLLLLAICDILQTCNCLFYAMPCILLQKLIFGDNFDLYYNPVVCGMLYYVGIGCMVFIAINRYVAVCRFSIYHRVFHANRTRFYILGAWIFASLSAMCQALPGFGYHFYPYWYSWGFETTVGNYYFTWYNRAVEVILFSILILCYASIIIKRPAKINATDGNAIDKAAKIKRERAERVLALQFCLISSIFMIYIIVNQLPIINRFFYLFTTLYYIVFLNCNPFIYFAFNSDIREHVLKMMGKAKKVNVITVTQTVRSAWY